jgi:hypothetical protein
MDYSMEVIKVASDSNWGAGNLAQLWSAW